MKKSELKQLIREVLTKIDGSFKPTSNNTGTVAIGKKHFLLYRTNFGNFYSDMSVDDWVDWAQDPSGVRNRLLQFAKDEKTWRQENPKSKSGYSDYLKQGGRIWDNINEDQNQKRFVVTADFYVWSNDDRGAKKEAQKIMSELKDQYDNNASVITIHEQPFGSRDSKSI